MKLLQLINSIEALNVLATTKLPAKVSYKLGVFLAKIAPEIDTYNKTKTVLLNQYGVEEKVKGKSTGKYTFPDKDNAGKFIKEMEELGEQEVKVEIPEVNVKDLGDNQIEPKHFGALEWLIKE